MDVADPEHTWGHTIAFGEAYYRAAIRLLKAVHADADAIAGVSSVAAAALRAGHKVYANLTTGHMPPYELASDREGNPALFEFIEPRFGTPESFAAMRAGDALFTHCVSESVRAARDAGVYVVVCTTYFFNNRHVPPGKIPPNPNNWMPEDVASVVIDSHIPWDQGLVHIPEVPEMPVFPGSSIPTCAIHWMITAETANALSTGRTPDGTIGRRYVDILLERLADVHDRDTDKWNETAVTIARRIIAGGRYFVRSRNFGVQSEAQGVAQGLMLTNAFEPRPAAEGGDRDIFVIAAVSPDDPQDMAWAEEARDRGNFIVGIGPTENDGLTRRCDVYFDDRCRETAGVLTLPGYAESLCPATGIINNIILYTLTAQFVDEMCRRGAAPYFWRGFYLNGGKEYSEIMRPFFLKRGY
jgi:uncharacterized phosphosugar-binding protein